MDKFPYQLVSLQKTSNSVPNLLYTAIPGALHPTLCISALAFALYSTTPLNAAPIWGSAPVSDQYRPTTDWHSQFPSSPHILASGSVQKAVDQCDAVAGQDNPCVVQLTSSSRFPVFITRSKTKLVSLPQVALKNGPVEFEWINISNRNDAELNKIVIDGLNMTGPDAGNREVTAISISGKNIRHVAVINNTISHFKSRQNAHAIAVFGRGGQAGEAISEVLIDSNDVHHMKTGSSESIVVNGNVTRWAISNNRIWSVDNIAIDAIGGEGISPTVTIDGRTYPGEFDQARYGFIESNAVRDMTVRNNPAYTGTDSWVAAIYIDGGAHINVSNNSVEGSDWGYEVGAENCVETKHITVTGNTARNNSHGDFLIGGWNTQGYKRQGLRMSCDPHATQDNSEGHGYVRNVTAAKNRFMSDPDTVRISRILAQHRVWNTIITDQEFEPVNANSPNGRAYGDSNAIRN